MKEIEANLRSPEANTPGYDLDKVARLEKW